MSIFRNSWILLTAAVISCAAVVGFGWYLDAQVASQREAAKAARSAESQRVADLRMGVMAKESADDRRQLDTVLAADVITVADIIERAGTAAGVPLTLNNAVPENAQKGGNVHAVAFSVEASGKFPAILRVAQLLETIPMASSIESLELSRTAGSAQWQLNATIRVLTTVNISS